MILKKLKCKKCGHEWIPRTDPIKECPKCKNRNWNKRKKKK